MGNESFPGVKRPGRGVDHPPPSRDKVKERVQLYLYSPSGPLCPVRGRILPLAVQRRWGWENVKWIEQVSGRAGSVTRELSHYSFKSFWCQYSRHSFNPLNAELNPICHLLALLGAHLILHFSSIRVNVLTPWWLDMMPCLSPSGDHIHNYVQPWSTSPFPSFTVDRNWN